MRGFSNLLNMENKIVIDADGKQYLWKSGDLQTNLGVIKAKDAKDGLIKTHLGKEMICLPASFIDKLSKIKRGPATLTKKDVGVILANVPITKATKIVDAGTGCGVLASFLARISDHVTSYENRESHLDIAKKNFEFLGVKVTTKNKDVSLGISEKNLDLITLDLQSPENVLEHAKKALKKGGYLVTFLPNIAQVSIVVDAAKSDFLHLKTVESIEREWIVEGVRLRPKNMGLLHTGFLSFFRKI